MTSRTKRANGRAFRPRVPRAIEVERFAAALAVNNACREASDWCAGKTLAEAWDTCPFFDWMTWMVDNSPRFFVYGWRTRRLNGMCYRITRAILREVCGCRTHAQFVRRLALAVANGKREARIVRPLAWALANTWPPADVSRALTIALIDMEGGFSWWTDEQYDRFAVAASKRPCAILRRVLPMTKDQSWIWYEGFKEEEE